MRIHRCGVALIPAVTLILGHVAHGFAATNYQMTTLVSFSGSPPCGNLVADASGNIYGTTLFGGSSSAGTIFKLSPTRVFTTLSGMPGNATRPGNLMIDAAGNLYGATATGGTAGLGAVFELASGAHFTTTLASLTNSSGWKPYDYNGLVADAAGNLYGTASQGGPGGWGTVYQVAAGTHTVTAWASFNDSNGGAPEGPLYIDPAGNIYGTTYGSNPGSGTVFEITNSHTLITLATFGVGGSEGYEPESGLVMDSHGNLYGTTIGSGNYNQGNIYEIAAGSHTAVTIASLDGTNSGTYAFGTLIIDAAGDLFGTAETSGINGGGTVFELPVGAHDLTVLASFGGTSGYSLYGALLADGNGNFYGTTTRP